MPGSAFSVSFSCGVPEIVGADVFSGAASDADVVVAAVVVSAAGPDACPAPTKPATATSAAHGDDCCSSPEVPHSVSFHRFAKEATLRAPC